MRQWVTNLLGSYTTLAGTGDTSVGIANSGVSHLVAGATYVLAPPVRGCYKTILITDASSLATVVRASTNASTGIKFGNDGATLITFPVTTLDRSVQMVGINSTRWSVINVHPYTTAANTPSLGTT
jgi:hypothetical protein